MKQIILGILLTIFVTNAQAQTFEVTRWIVCQKMGSETQAVFRNTCAKGWYFVRYA